MYRNMLSICSHSKLACHPNDHHQVMGSISFWDETVNATWSLNCVPSKGSLEKEDGRSYVYRITQRMPNGL